MQPFREVRSPARRKFNEIYRYEFVGTSVKLNFWQRDKIWIGQRRTAVQVEHSCICCFVCNMTCHALRDEGWQIWLIYLLRYKNLFFFENTVQQEQYLMLFHCLSWSYDFSSQVSKVYMTIFKNVMFLHAYIQSHVKNSASFRLLWRMFWESVL